MPEPLVAIHTLVYNHEPFLRNYFLGVVSQKTNFPFIAIVHDDCSTDGSVEIIKDFAEKYPDIIKPIYEKKNIYNNEGSIHIFRNMREMSYSAKYIAICEGDDYWTDPFKLQKQVDFLESNPNYSVCWHRCKRWYYETNTYTDDFCHELIETGVQGVDISIDRYFSNWYTQPLTMVYRKDALDLEWCGKFKYFRDVHLMYNLLMHGKGYILSFEGGVYTIHSGGVASSISRKQYCDISLPMDREFYWKTLDKGPKKTYIETLDACIKEYSKNAKWKALHCAFVRFVLTGHLRGFIRQIKFIINQ